LVLPKCFFGSPNYIIWSIQNITLSYQIAENSTHFNPMHTNLIHSELVVTRRISPIKYALKTPYKQPGNNKKSDPMNSKLRL